MDTAKDRFMSRKISLRNSSMCPPEWTKDTKKYHYISIMMTKIKNSEHSKC